MLVDDRDRERAVIALQRPDSHPGVQAVDDDDIGSGQL
jgi:hypothetical protein